MPAEYNWVIDHTWTWSGHLTTPPRRPTTKSIILLSVSSLTTFWKLRRRNLSQSRPIINWWGEKLITLSLAQKNGASFLYFLPFETRHLFITLVSTYYFSSIFLLELENARMSRMPIFLVPPCHFRYFEGMNVSGDWRHRICYNFVRTVCPKCNVLSAGEKADIMY